jgi:hypothetical protein
VKINLSLLDPIAQIDAILTATPKAIFRAYALARTPRRTQKPPKLRPCQWCGQEYGAREMRLHVPKCRLLHT